MAASAPFAPFSPAPLIRLPGAAVSAVLAESIKTLGLTPEALDGYLTEEAEYFPAGVDPIRYVIENVNPAELRKIVTLRHEAATAKAEAAKLREQLAQRTSKQVQASKQSLPPTRRVAEPAPQGLGKVLADLGVAKLSDIPGFGWGNTDGV